MNKDELGVVAANLTALSDAARSVYERRLAHLCGLARSFRGESLSDSLRGEYAALTAEVLTFKTPPALDRPFGASLRRTDKIGLCRFICGVLGQGGTALAAEALLGYRPSDSSDEPVQDRVSYMRNYYADRAYTVFAAALDQPTVTYPSDFAGVCEDVYYGRAKYCILPVENSSDGMLTGFRGLIGKYELMISLACDVQTSGEDSYTRFALLRRGIGAPVKAEGRRRFEFSVTFEDDGSATLCDILDAADAFGLELYRISSLPASYSGRGGSYDVTLTCGSGGLSEFLTYLSLEVPQFSAVGLYTHIGG